jgi:hypothetical protein
MFENKRMLARIFRIATPTASRDASKSKARSLAKERIEHERRRIEQENDKLYKRLVAIPISGYLDHSKLKVEFERSKKMRELRARPRYTSSKSHRKPNSITRLTQTPLPELKTVRKQESQNASPDQSLIESESHHLEAPMPRSGSVPLITVFKSSRSVMPQSSNSSHVYLTDQDS